MGYFSRLQLDLLEAYSAFLKSRHLNEVARYTRTITPVDARIELLRAKHRIEASNGVVFDGQSFKSASEAAPIQEIETPAEVESAPAAEVATEAQEDTVPSPAEEVVAADTATEDVPILESHPELSGEVIVFEDEHIKLLDALEQEFNPGFLESSEMAMKTLDRTKLVVTASQLNSKDHMGMLITPVVDDPEAQSRAVTAYFVSAHELPEEMSLQVSHGKHRELIKVAILHPDGDSIGGFLIPASNKIILESRPL